MQNAGFVQIQQQDYKHSDIPEWSRYNLDCSNIADRAIDPLGIRRGAQAEFTD